MADENLNTFTRSLVLTGLLVLALVTFAGIFFAANNPIGLSTDEQNILSITKNNLSSNILEMDGDGNDLLEVASNTDPTISSLGSKDSVSTSFSIFGTAKAFYSSTKLLISWIFAGEVGQMLLSLFGGLLAITAVYLIYRAIKGY